MRWFLSKVNYDNTETNKKVSESYVIAALSFTEAEGILLRYVAKNATDTEVKAIKPIVFDEILTGTGENFYKLKANREDPDGKERNSLLLAVASSCKEAIKKVNDLNEEYDIQKVEKTGIIAVLSVDDVRNTPT